MKITGITTYTVEVPIRRELMITSSLGTHSTTRLVLLRLDTDEGIVGVGEATVTPRWSGETAWGAKAMIDCYLAPAVLGLEVSDIAGALYAMEQVTWANPFAKSAIEMAMLDAWGKAEGKPIYDLLGGAVRPLAIPIRFSLAAHAPDVTAANAARRVAWGHRTVKVKVGLDPVADVARVKAVRKAIGEDILLTVDANGGWSIADAIWALNEMKPLDLTLAEQPVRREDLDGMAEVRRHVDVPVMADEGVFTLWDAEQALRKEACDIIAVYPGKNGGITISKQICEMAAEKGVACAVGSNLELDPGTAAMCHLTVATENIAAHRYHGDILGTLYHETPVVLNPLALQGGVAHCPDTPGLGVSMDWDTVKQLSI
ncbi:MAG: mandelate racemase/muconate lactonizing enzyme family protein [Actinomycetota bacterium]